MTNASYDLQPFASSYECFDAYQRLTRAALVELIQVAAAEGWTNCTITPAAISTAQLKAELVERINATARTVLPALAAAKRIGISGSAMDALGLLASIDADPACASLIALLHPANLAECSIALLQKLIAICSGAPLKSKDFLLLETCALIEVADDARLSEARRGIRVTDRVLDLFRGDITLDPHTANIAELQFANAFQPTHKPTTQMLAAWKAEPAPLMVAYGVNGSGRHETLQAIAARRNMPTLNIRCSMLPTAAPTFRKALRAALRECAILEAVPLFENIDGIKDSGLQQELGQTLATYNGVVFATANGPVTGTWNDAFQQRPIVEFEIALPVATARDALWQQALPDAPPELVTECAVRYSVTPAVIAAVGRAALATVDGDGTALTQAHIATAMRAQFDRTLSGLATRIDVKQTWDDLVMPAEQFEKVVELVSRRQNRQQVLHDWGFAEKIGKGFGTAALFSGPPGTGKTMVAGLIARELGLDLYQVDLSKMVSKYIGETEKQLAILFDAAETGHAIILFDEADALFAKRSEVKSSNDRYANMGVNYLLQRLEVFTGIALLTTNHENSIDEAFRRRLSVHLQFTAPDQQARAALWSAMLPKRAAVTNDIDAAALASNYNLSGGYIKNAVLRAAYLAAGDGTAISMRHIERAALAECEAMGKVVRG